MALREEAPERYPVLARFSRSVMDPDQPKHLPISRIWGIPNSQLSALVCPVGDD